MTEQKASTGVEQAVRHILESFEVPSGAIASLAVAEARVTLVLEIDPAKAKAIEPVRQQLEHAIGHVPGVQAARVILTGEKRAEPPLLPHVKQVIAVASGKGGVGKSTVATNLAVAAAQAGLQVGLLDADIYGPSLPTLMGVASGPPPLDDNRKMIPPVAHGVKVMSIGFMVDPEKALVWRGPMVHSALMQMLRDVAWGALDVLFLDMPPGTGDAQLTIAQMGKLTGAVIVSTPQDLALADARRAIGMFTQVKVPVCGLVENMSFYTCPHCGQRDDLFGHGGAEAEALKLGIPFLGALPLHLSIRQAGDAGCPLMISAPDSPHAHAFRQVMATLALKKEKAEPKVASLTATA